MEYLLERLIYKNKIATKFEIPKERNKQTKWFPSRKQTNKQTKTKTKAKKEHKVLYRHATYHTFLTEIHSIPSTNEAKNIIWGI